MCRSHFSYLFYLFYSCSFKKKKQEAEEGGPSFARPPPPRSSAARLGAEMSNMSNNVEHL